MACVCVPALCLTSSVNFEKLLDLFASVSSFVSGDSKN